MAIRNLAIKISTSNLLLRKLVIEDAEDLQQLLARNKDHMVPWIPWAAGEPEPIMVKKEKIRIWNGEFNLDQKYTYGIYSKEKEKLVGLSFLFTRQGPGILEIGYVIDFEESGKGYATETSYALTKLSFAHIGIDKVVIHCNSKNVASSRIPEKLGYSLEGTHKMPSTHDDGVRDENMIWAMFIDEFAVEPSREPVSFEMEKGW